MKWSDANDGSTAIPRKPRSTCAQVLLERFRAVVVTPPETTRRMPPCELTSMRPSGVKAIAVGATILATRVSVKLAGTVPPAGAASAVEAATTARNKLQRFMGAPAFGRADYPTRRVSGDQVS